MEGPGFGKARGPQPHSFFSRLSLPSESLQAGPLLEEKLPDEGDAIVMHFKNPFDVRLSM